MIEDELRATFARQEAMIPATGPLRAAIDRQVVRRRRRRTVARAVGAAAAVLLVGGAVPAVSALRHAAPATVPGASTPHPASAQPLDLLLIGSDNRERRPDGEARADTVMLVHVPADRSGVYLVNLPRDGAVTVGGRNVSRLSDTLLAGGAKLTGRAVTELTGVTLDATVTVDFRALRRVTDAVGGVDVCLDQAFTSRHNGKAYPVGCHRLTGADVVPVLQARYGLRDGAHERDRNGQRYLRALAGKLTSDGTLHDPARLWALVAAARDGITVQGGTASLTSLLQTAASIRDADIVGISSRAQSAGPDGRETIYPGVGPGLFAAVRNDKLAAWAAAHPQYLLPR